MATKINSASRLHKLLTTAKAPDKARTIDTWASVFGIEDNNDLTKAALVSQHLASMQFELTLIERSLESMGYSEKTYQPIFKKTANALSILSLGSPWSSVNQYLTPEVLSVLNFISETLPNEELEIDPDELESLRSLVDELEVLLMDSTLPLRLIELIQHQLVLIRKALAEYPIAGAKALLEARRAAVGEILEETESLDANSNSVEVSKFKSLMQALNKVVDAVIKTDNLITIGRKLEQLGLDKYL